jgi:hypothetical protein
MPLRLNIDPLRDDNLGWGLARGCGGIADIYKQENKNRKHQRRKQKHVHTGVSALVNYLMLERQRSLLALHTKLTFSTRGSLKAASVTRGLISDG